MRNHLKKIFMPGIFYLITLQAYTQEPVYFSTVDSVTYNQYLRGDWKELVTTGNQSLKDGLDFYYLRMRMGWAMFARSKYRLAVPHYQKALSFNSSDPLALELLLSSLEYSGRHKDAIRLSKDINAFGNPDLYRKYQTLFKEFSFFYTHSNSSSGSLIENYNYNINSSSEGVQKISRSFDHLQVSLSHLFFNHNLVMEHTVGYLRRKEFSYFISQQDEILNSDQLMNQFEYKSMIHFTPASGLTITPGIIFSYISIPVYRQYNGISPWSSQRVLTGRVSEKQFFYFLNTSKEFTFNSFGLSGGTGTINDFNLSQLGVHWKFFPLANLNLYYALNVYLQNKSADSVSETNLINQHRLGIKLSKFLWLEAETTLGGINSFYDVDNKIIYNSLEAIEDLYALRLIVPSGKHLNYSIGLTKTNTSSTFIPRLTPLSPQNKNAYNTFSITGGLLWNL